MCISGITTCAGTAVVLLEAECRGFVSSNKNRKTFVEFTLHLKIHYFLAWKAVR